MNPSDAIEAIEKPLSSLPYSLSRHILEHLRKLTSHETRDWHYGEKRGR
ncbi:putative GTP-binding protein [Escherichia coli]|uniref:Putative GTP-binding protein n=1 Tax=Escherichia coli TaxID=562 RepID=A0A377DNC0_ECOLX|nr:putative GTP-binding protein [Escherichia coli]